MILKYISKLKGISYHMFFFELKPWGKAPRRLILNKEEKRSYRRELTKGPNQQLEREKKHEKAS